MTTKEQNNTLNFYQIHSTTSLRKGMETRTTAWRICLLILGLKGLLKVMWIKLVKPSGGFTSTLYHEHHFDPCCWSF